MSVLRITPTIAIDESELDEHFIQSSGPGGQNVNKVATAVQLRFDVAGSAALPEPVRQKLTRLAGRRITADDILVIDARRFRSQERNRADARARLIELIRQAAMPNKKRIPTRPTLAVKRQRLEKKKIRSATKRGRARPVYED